MKDRDDTRSSINKASPQTKPTLMKNTKYSGTKSQLTSGKTVLLIMKLEYKKPMTKKKSGT